jgi:hypothetical protein
MGDGTMQTRRSAAALAAIGLDHAAQDLFHVLPATSERRLVALLTLNASAHGSFSQVVVWRDQCMGDAKGAGVRVRLASALKASGNVGAVARGTP